MTKNIRGLKIGWTQKKNTEKTRKTRLITSHFRSPGSVFTKEASFIRLLENSLNSSRAFVQKPALVLVVPAVHIFCVAMAVCVNLIRRLTGGVSFEVNRILISTRAHLFIGFFPLQKLDKFIAEINQLKSKHQSYSVQKTFKARINQQIDVRSILQGDNKVIERVLNCCEEAEKQTKRHQEELSKTNRLLMIASFASIFLVYIQFFLLLILIANTPIRAGYVFLLVCTSYLSYIVVKVSSPLGVAQPILQILSIRENKSNMKNYAPTFTRMNVLNFPKREPLRTTTYWIITV